MRPIGVYDAHGGWTPVPTPPEGRAGAMPSDNDDSVLRMPRYVYEFQAWFPIVHSREQTKRKDGSVAAIKRKCTINQVLPTGC